LGERIVITHNRVRFHAGPSPASGASRRAVGVVAIRGSVRRSLYVEYPELAAPLVQAHPFGRSVEHPGQGIVQALGGAHGGNSSRAAQCHLRSTKCHLRSTFHVDVKPAQTLLCLH